MGYVELAEQVSGKVGPGALHQAGAGFPLEDGLATPQDGQVDGDIIQLVWIFNQADGRPQRARAVIDFCLGQVKGVFTLDISGGNIIAINSFSKILAPGLRLGWIQAAPEVVRRLAEGGLLTSGGGMNPFTSAIVRGLIEDGQLAGNIARLRRVYSERVRAMDDSLRRHLPEAVFMTPQGGYFFWVRIPGCDTPAVREAAQAQQTDYRPGVLFSSQGGLREHMRLSISFYDPPDIELGLQRLAEALEIR